MSKRIDAYEVLASANKCSVFSASVPRDCLKRNILAIQFTENAISHRRRLLRLRSKSAKEICESTDFRKEIEELQRTLVFLRLISSLYEEVQG